MCTNFPWNKVEYDMNDIRLQVIKTTLTEDIIQLIIIDPNMRRFVVEHAFRMQHKMNFSV